MPLRERVDVAVVEGVGYPAPNRSRFRAGENAGGGTDHGTDRFGQRPGDAPYAGFERLPPFR